MPPPATPPEITSSITLPEQPLAGEISVYLNHLAAQHAHPPLALTIKIHPLNIAEGLAREFAAHERELATGEKSAAHECADPCHPLENAAVRHELCNLIAEMTAPIADATLAHHLLFLINIGKNLPPPYAADDHLALCASFDARRGCMRQRFAPQRETAPPPNEAAIESGLTLVCEPLESGYYRIPDDDRHRSASGLLMSDSLYGWTLQTLLVFYLALGNPGNVESVEGEILLQAAKFRFLLRLLSLMHPDKTYDGSSVNTVMQARNVEHSAATQILERNAGELHHPERHAYTEETTLKPE